MIPERGVMPSQHKRIGKPHACRLAAIAVLLLASVAPASAESTLRATSSVERHWTSNALDSDRALPDFYTLLRGALEWNFGGDDASAVLSAHLEASRHDRIRIEDDRAFALTAQLTRELSPAIEIRGTLGYRASSEGDDLAIGPLTLGTRTFRHTFSAGGQIGIDLGNATSLVLEASDSFDNIAATRFEYGLLAPVKIDPDRNSAQSGFRLLRTLGPLALGATGSVLRVAVARLGNPPIALSFTRYMLRGEVAYSGPDGSTVGVAIGGELLSGDNDIYHSLRPSWQLGFAKKLTPSLELRGTYFGRFEAVDSDDPLASWLRRAELEIGTHIRRNFAIAAGVFSEVKDNLLWENSERRNGLYAELTCEATPSTAIVLRLDFSRTFKTVIDERQKTVDVFVGLSAKI